VKNEKERLSILAVDVLDLHLLPEFSFAGFFFFTAGKKPLISIMEF